MIMGSYVMFPWSLRRHLVGLAVAKLPLRDHAVPHVIVESSHMYPSRLHQHLAGLTVARLPVCGANALAHMTM